MVNARDGLCRNSLSTASLTNPLTRESVIRAADTLRFQHTDRMRINIDHETGRVPNKAFNRDILHTLLDPMTHWEETIASSGTL